MTFNLREIIPSVPLPGSHVTIAADDGRSWSGTVISISRSVDRSDVRDDIMIRVVQSTAIDAIDSTARETPRKLGAGNE